MTQTLPLAEERSHRSSIDKSAPLVSTRSILNILASLVLLLGAIPVVRAVWVLFSVGANCASNDYVGWVATVDSLLRGTCNWFELPLHTYWHPHFVIIPALLELAQIYSGIWSIKTDALFAMILTVVSVYLQWDMMRESLSKRMQTVLLACLLAVNFATTQYCILLSGFFSITIAGSCVLGFTLSVWALTKFRGQRKRERRAFALMASGLVISAYSWGTIAPASICLVPALFGLGYRSWRAAAAWCAASVVSWFPYLCFLQAIWNEHSTLPLGHGQFNLVRILDVLGRPLSNNIAVELSALPEAIIAGTAGSIMLVVAVSLLVARKAAVPGLVPALILGSYSIFNAILIAAAREHIAPWYAVPVKFFWVSVIALSIYCISQFDRKELANPTRILLAAIGCGALALFTWRYVWVNESYDDKHFYLKSRAPASESYQRHYATAPTYGEPLLFQWQSGGANQSYARSLGTSLERHGLLCFGKHQQWTLQGDYFLNNVGYFQEPRFDTPMWTDSTRPIHAVAWHDYHHLDMALKAPQVVRWKVNVPANSNSILRTAVCPGFLKTEDTFEGTTARIEVQSSDAAKKRASDKPLVLERKVLRNSDWLPFEIALDKYAGKQIDIRFLCAASSSSETDRGYFPRTNSNWVVFQYPRIDVELLNEGTNRLSTSSTPKTRLSRPSNTDLSPDFPGSNDAGLILPAVPGKMGTFDCRETIARNYSHLLVRSSNHGSAGAGAGAGVLVLTFNYSNYPRFVALLPLLEDAAEHAYTYDLKLLQAPADARLATIEIASQNESQDVRISDARLLSAFEN